MTRLPFLTLAWISLLLVSGCRSKPEVATEVAPCCRKPLTNTPASDRSLFQLDSEWTSDLGKTIRLGTLRGHPQVVALFFSHCEFACPLLVARMKAIEGAFPPSGRNDAEFLLVSIDPDRDTPAALHEYRARQGLSLRRWTLLTGSAGSVRELAALLGVQYQRDARGQYAHSNLLTILNAEGEVVHQSSGLRAEVDDLVAAVVRLSPPAH